MKRIVYSAIVSALLISGTASAASLKDIIKIGIVDMGKVYAEYAEKSDNARKLREKRARLNRQIREEAAAIRKMENDLKERMHNTSENERRRRSAEIEFRKDEVANMLTRGNAELDREEADIVKPMREDIYEAIRFVANKQGVKIVLDSLYVGFSDIELDMTDAVLARVRLILAQKQNQGAR
ncbi:MAG: OmpH family outer membrane protein [Spirochaetota bacterium]|jgi:outer membrane protein|nr:OmpH family outer membrane protein [Spirochaetota bacterium]